MKYTATISVDQVPKPGYRHPGIHSFSCENDDAALAQLPTVLYELGLKACPDTYRGVATVTVNGLRDNDGNVLDLSKVVSSTPGVSISNGTISARADHVDKIISILPEDEFIGTD